MTQSAQNVGFDLALLNAAVTAVTHRCAVIVDAEGNPQSGFIMVGKDSPEYRAVMNEIRIDNIKRAAKRKTQLDTSTDAGAAVVAKTVDANDRKIALAVVTGWFGFNSEGAPMFFNKELVVKMFDRFPTWQEKVLADLEADANFTPA